MALYEDYLLANYGANLVAFWPLGESSGAPVDITSNAFSAAAQAGLTYGQGGLPNSAKTAIRFTGTSNGASYVQLESAPGSRLRLGAGTGAAFTVACWFKRAAAGTTCSTGTGGIAMEPLVMKGMAESETAGLNANYSIGLEQIGSDFYLATDAELKTGSTNKAVGRNLRMIDCTGDSATNLITTRTDQGLATAFVHNYSNGDRIRFGGTTMPTGITAGTWYFIINTDQANGQFKVSTTLGGSAVSLGTNGTALWVNHARATTLILSTDTSWHMAAFRWDGTDRMQSYLDGILVEDEKVTMPPPDDLSQQLCTIGCGTTSGGVRTAGGGFNGTIGHVSFWNAAISGANLLDLFQVGLQKSTTIAGRANVASGAASITIAGRAAARSPVATTNVGRAAVKVTTGTTIAGRAAVPSGSSSIEISWGEMLVMPTVATMGNTISGRVDVQAANSKSIVGRAAVKVTNGKLQTGRAAVRVSTGTTIAGRTDVRAAAGTTTVGRASVRTPGLLSIAGRAAVKVTAGNTISGRAVVQLHTSATIAGRAVVVVKGSTTIAGRARVIITTRMISGRAAVRTSRMQTIAGRATIGPSQMRATTIGGRLYVLGHPKTTIRGKAKVVIRRRILVGSRSVELNPFGTKTL